MELRQLKYFLKVAETLNFSEAAKALYVTQSTLSQQVKQLEQEFGTQLLTRTSHSVSLTEAGYELVPYARKTIDSANLCKTLVADLSNLRSGTLNIGVTYTFSPILNETLFSFMKLYPHIKLNIFYKPMAELMKMLLNGELDFVLAFRPSQHVEGIESHVLFQNSLVAVVGDGHPLANASSVTPKILAGYDMALPAIGLQARNAFDRIVAPAQREWRIRIELNEVHILLDLIRGGKMATVLAEATIHNARQVKSIPIAVDGTEMDGCVHTLRGAYRKHSMLTFIKMLSESIAVRERRNAWL